METIRVYRLADPAPLVERRAAIAEALFPDVRGDGPRRALRVAPATGALAYLDRSELWKPGARRALPPHGEAATKAASDFLRGAIERLARAPGLERLAPLPDRAEPISARGVVHREGGRIDHWLCVFGVSLYPSAKARTAARVMGAALEVRVGDEGKIIGLVSRWRPLAREAPIERRFEPVPANLAPRELVYRAIGAAGEPALLAPYHFGRDEEEDDGGDFYPASDRSLVAEIIQRPSSGGVSVGCVVAGGSDDIEFRWSYWEPTAVFERGRQSLPSVPVRLGDRVAASRARLPRGVYALVVDIRDRRSGASLQIERMIFTQDPTNRAPRGVETRRPNA